MNWGLLFLFLLVITAIILFCVFMLKSGKIRLIHLLYLSITAATVITLLALAILIIIKGSFKITDDSTAARIIDAITNVGLFIPALVLCLSLTFTRGWEKLQFWCWLLFIIPLISFVLVWTNPLHHLFYKVFSIRRSSLEIGPGSIVSIVYSYICFILSVGVIIFFAISSKNAAYRKQASLLIIGTIIPMIVSMSTTLQILKRFDEVLIYWAPLSYALGLVIFHGIAIFRFKLLDIKPLAMETILNRISDCYLVVNEHGIVVSHNKAFADIFGEEYKLKIHSSLYDVAEESSGMSIHTLIASIASCRESETTISYEQSITLKKDAIISIKYYMIDITALNISGKNVGFVIFFKDITRLKENDRELHNSYTRLMEHKQLAFLGQMLGGISHNLKTPIMSISGSCNAVGNLMEEASASLGDPEVTKEDYLEIYSEVKQWVSKIQEACSYMSDIITAVKGQATNFNTNSELEFTLEDVVKRVTLLLRHELAASTCSLTVNNLTNKSIHIYGDINSMVQVINNLISNSIYAMKDTGGEIVLEASTDSKNLLLKIKDRGTGIPEYVKKDLFNQMITSKGAMGSGLGIFMSKTVIKARFDGTMWFEDNPGGGSIFIISLPLNKVQIIEKNSENI